MSYPRPNNFENVCRALENRRGIAHPVIGSGGRPRPCKAKCLIPTARALPNLVIKFVPPKASDLAVVVTATGDGGSSDIPSEHWPFPTPKGPKGTSLTFLRPKAAS
jgi:hypothetical protein